MITIRGKIPVTIFPAFWIVAVLIALMLSQGNILQMGIWVGVVFVSVLFHEYGHALTALFFGRKPRIELVAMGGLTYHDGDKLPFWKQFFITLNGPLFGFIIVIVTYLIRDIPALSKGYPAMLLTQIFYVNIIWTVVNLLPIMPLDGGQLLRLGMEKIFAFKGLRYTLIISAVLSLTASLFLFVTQNILAGAVFFLFAFENFNNYRKSCLLSPNDQSDELKKKFQDAEIGLRLGNKEQSLQAFEALRAQAKEGIIYNAATQYAAFIHYELGHVKEAYQLLLSLKEKLDPDAMALLHRIAFELEDFQKVMEHAGPVFQFVPEAEVALRSAYAAAQLKLVDATIGWLQTARQSGVENMKEIVLEKAFDFVREAPEFADFVKTL
jgi:stage IV sporulation protein FB